MNAGQGNRKISIEDMARVFNELNISLKKLLELYSYPAHQIGDLYFDEKEIEKYLCQEDIEDYLILRNKYTEADGFMMIDQVEAYEKEVRLRQIVRNFGVAIKKKIPLEDTSGQGINTDLRSIILHVELRPLMYLRKCSVYELDAFIRNIVYGGYALGKTYADTLDENSYWGYFSEWLGKKYESESSMSWCHILMEQEKDEKKAFERFFDEFRDYLEQVENYKNRSEVIEALANKLNLPESFEVMGLEAVLENYPNKYAKEYYERNCYLIKMFRVEHNQDYGKCRQYLQSFYLESDLGRSWVRYKDTILYQTLEEFLKDNSRWYEVESFERS